MEGREREVDEGDEDLNLIKRKNQARKVKLMQGTTLSCIERGRNRGILTHSSKPGHKIVHTILVPELS